MTKLPSALTPEEWGRGVAVRYEGTLNWPLHFGSREPRLRVPVLIDVDIYASRSATFAALIAVSNDLLPDDDARKITWRTVATLRDAARVAALEGLTSEDLSAIADSLEAYLRPEQPDN